MKAADNRAGFWNYQVWAAIDDGVAKAVGAIPVAQKVFPATQLAGVTSVPADEFDPMTEPMMRVERGKYSFRTFVRANPICCRGPRAFVILDFSWLGEKDSARNKIELAA